MEKSNTKTDRHFLKKMRQSQALFNKFWIVCKESRIEHPSSYYGCFYLGPFDESLSQTLAHNLRRTLLSELPGYAITSVEIEGVLHKFSNIPGIQETVLDILCNLQKVVLRQDSNILPINSNKQEQLSDANIITNSALTRENDTNPEGFLQAGYSNCLEQILFLNRRGPGVVKASDLILPVGLQCVNPDQYIATLAEDGVLNMKLFVNKGKNYIKQKQKNQVFLETANPLVGNSTNTKTNRIFLDAVFMPVTKVNTIVSLNEKCHELEPSITKFMEDSPISLAAAYKDNLTFSTDGQYDLSLTTENKNLLYPASKPGGTATEVNTNLYSTFDIALKQQSKKCHVVLEIWTNGSLHPRKALYDALRFLSNLFGTLENVKMLGSMFKSRSNLPTSINNYIK